MLFFFHLSIRYVQLSTRFYNSLPVRHANKPPCLLLPFAVLLVDGDIASLPIYHLTLARNHFNLIHRNTLEIYCRIEVLRFESLITY